MNLADYVGLVKRQSKLIAAVVAVIVLLAVVLTALQTRLYTASTDILVDLAPATDLVASQSNGRVENARLLENEVGFLESRIVVDAVAGELGFVPTMEIVASPGRDFITVSAIENSPDRALEASLAYSTTYLELRRQLAVEEFVTTAGVVQEQIDRLDERLAEIDSSGGLAADREERRAPLAAQRAVYAQGLANIQLNTELTSGAVGRIVSPAALPHSPSSPQPVINVGLALIAGIMLALFVAVTRDKLSDKIVGRAMAQQLIGDRPILAQIPRYSAAKRASVLDGETHSIESEAFRSLRTSLAFASLSDSKRVIQVTSSTMGEGKSEVVANLALALARGGKTVVAVDADLRRPTLANRFGLDPDVPGLSSVVSRETNLRTALVQIPDLPTLRVLPSGPMPGDPAAFVGSTRFQRVLEVLSEKFDFVLVDTPPAGMVSDPLTISQLVDGVVVVARHNRTGRSELTQTLVELERLDSPVMGLVLNGLQGGRAYEQSYYHQPDRVVDEGMTINLSDCSHPDQFGLPPDDAGGGAPPPRKRIWARSRS